MQIPFGRAGVWAQPGPLWWVTLTHLGNEPLGAPPTDSSPDSQITVGTFTWLSRRSDLRPGVLTRQAQKKDDDHLAAWFYFRTTLLMATL